MIQMTGRCPVPEDGGTQTVTRPISEIMDLTLVIILQKPKIHFLQLFIIVSVIPFYSFSSFFRLFFSVAVQ